MISTTTPHSIANFLNFCPCSHTHMQRGRRRYCPHRRPRNQSSPDRSSASYLLLLLFCSIFIPSSPRAFFFHLRNAHTTDLCSDSAGTTTAAAWTSQTCTPCSSTLRTRTSSSLIRWPRASSPSPPSSRPLPLPLLLRHPRPRQHSPRPPRRRLRQQQ